MNYPETLMQALAVHVLLRGLGFPADDIWIHRNPEPLSDVLVVLKHRGKQCALTVGELRDPEWEQKWSKLVDDYNANRLPFEYATSWAATHMAEIVYVLRAKGIEPPANYN